MRAFIGIKLDDKALKITNNYFNMLYQEGVRGNYTDIKNIHLTLSFIGETDRAEELKGIINSLDVSKLNYLTIKGIKALKDMLIYEVDKTQELEELYNELLEKLKKENFEVDNKSFFPHITLVRETNKQVVKKISFTSKVEKINLFESIRIKGKIHYISKN